MISLLIRHRFVFAPQLLSDTIKPFAGLDKLVAFDKLLKEYLPDRRNKLIVMNPTDGAKEFTALFTQRYFPIHTIEYDDLSILLRGIPLRLKGMRSSDYEYFWGTGLAQILAKAVCTEPDFRGPVRMSRIPVLAEFQKKFTDKMIALELLNKIPDKGWELADIEDVLTDSPFAGLLLWCRWVFRKTDNRWLDQQDRSIDWNPVVVEKLKADWPECQRLENEMEHFNNSIKKDFPGRSAEIITYLHDKIDSKRLIEVLK